MVMMMEKREKANLNKEQRELSKINIERQRERVGTNVDNWRNMNNLFAIYIIALASFLTSITSTKSEVERCKNARQN